MTISLGFLPVLALIDSTSVGTLVLPIWLLLASGRPRVSRMLAYLGTVAGFYFVMGVLLSIGARFLLDDAISFAQSEGGAIALAVLAALMLATGVIWLIRQRDNKGGSGRLLAWRERAVVGTTGSSAAPLMALALTATAIEIAGMLPYLIAIGTMDQADLPLLVHGALLAGYCLLMILPAIVLMIVRLVAHEKITAPLGRINDWIMKHTAGATPWLLAILGFLLLRAAIERLGGLDALFAGF